MIRPDDQGVSRRDLFKRSLVGAAGLYGTGALEGTADAGADGKYPKETQGTAEYDFTAQSGALQPDKVVDSACQFCNSNCRLKVHLKAGRVIDITGETADPVQAGGLCVKGPMMAQLVYNRHRLTRPMKRMAGEKGSSDSKFEPLPGTKHWGSSPGSSCRSETRAR